MKKVCHITHSFAPFSFLSKKAEFEAIVFESTRNFLIFVKNYKKQIDTLLYSNNMIDHEMGDELFFVRVLLA
jgi:hypothetical protein